MAIIDMTQLELKDKRVLIREDLNVPMQHREITDPTRIMRALPTLRAALSAGAKVMVLSHLGRPEEGTFDAKYSLQKVADFLQQQLSFPVRFVKDWIDGVDVAAGECVVCENVRFEVGERSNQTSLAKKMAALCDIFVMDAFATAHRSEASTVGVASFASQVCMGPLLAAELKALATALEKPKPPLVAIVGGAKVSSKMPVLLSLLTKVDALIVGGGMANTFLKAAGHQVGESLFEEDWVAAAKDFLAAAKKNGVDVPLPSDVVVGTELSDDAVGIAKSISEVTATDKIFDIGPQTIGAYKKLINSAGTLLWNGPLGVFEVAAYRQGTAEIGKAVAISEAFSIAGGGDTIAAINMLGLAEKISYISTGGGAFLEYLQGAQLPAVAILQQRGET